MHLGGMTMNRVTVGFLVGVFSLSVLASSNAESQFDRGFYVSAELGINFASDLEFDVDTPRARGSICDEHINPFFEVMPGFCDDPNAPGTNWSNAIDRANGILAGAAVGYRFKDAGRFRMEFEYFYRETAHNETSAIEGRGGVSAAKLDGEVVIAEDRIGSLTSSNLFGNLYYDLIRSNRITPYIGFGLGVGFTNIDHGFLWVRNNNPDLITSIAPYFPADRLDDLRIAQQNLAGTASSRQAELSDSLLGYQLLFGLDLALTESVSVGVKSRRVAFERLRDGGELDRLRGHISSNRLDGSEPIAAVVSTNRLVFYGVSLNLKYRF